MNNNSLKRIVFRIFLTFLIFVFSQIGLESNSNAKTKRHLVLYGGIRDRYIYPIARNADIIVVGKIRYDQLKKLKQINPNLIILSSNHLLGTYRHYPDWDKIRKNEAWFAHDKNTGLKLKEKKYGWYLMNNASEEWRYFWANRIAKETYDLFDGVFIDDFWDRYIQKFVREGTNTPATPDKNLIASWDKNMVSFLSLLKKVYPKKIFINGAYEKYIHLVDGCMEESFIHSNWHSDSLFHNSASYIRSLRRIENIAKYGKMILAQSGSTGDNTGNIDKVYRLCFTSYFLISDKNISFNFHPSHTYFFKGFYQINDYALDLGKPRGSYYLYREGSLGPNLLPNGNFNEGLDSWQVRKGSPKLDSKVSLSGSSLSFQAQSDTQDKIRSQFIPVSGDTEYTISAFCKSEKNIPGSARYKKLGLQGRFYDINKQRIQGAPDLQFAAGTYDWQPFEITHTSPVNAAYFRLRLGFIGDGKGKGWIDNVYFGIARKRERIFRRDFTKGSIFVNYGNKDAKVRLNQDGKDLQPNIFKLSAQDGKILFRNNQ